jgi:hypothetical protein
VIAFGRRAFVAGTLGLLAAPAGAVSVSGEPRARHGLIGRMRAVAGQRDALIAILS